MEELKKSNFLAIFKNEDNSLKAPMTKEALVDELADYNFRGPWLDYLIDMYVDSEKLTTTMTVAPDDYDEDDNGEWVGEAVYQLNRKKAGGVGGPRTAYRIVWVEETPEGVDDAEFQPGYMLESKEVSGTEPVGKDEGWAGSISAAAKRGRQAVFAKYKSDTALINAVAEANAEDDEDEEDAEEDAKAA